MFFFSFGLESLVFGFCFGSLDLSLVRPGLALVWLVFFSSVRLGFVWFDLVWLPLILIVWFVLSGFGLVSFVFSFGLVFFRLNLICFSLVSVFFIIEKTKHQPQPLS